MKRQLPSQLLESQFLDPATRNTPLSETIRLGAQLMLQKAIELEVTEYLGRDHYQRHGEGLLRGYQDILYLFCDGIYLRLRREDKQAVAVLCAYGMKADGRKVLLHLAVGDKESTVCWKSFFEDMKRRGLKEPLLLVIDGNSGLRKAVRECFPDSWVQRCQVHRMRNILCKLPENARPGLKKLIQKAFTAQSYKTGLVEARAVVAMYQEQLPEAMKCLATDLEECLTALRFPEPHRKRIRTTNLLERLFGEGQRRAKVIPCS